MPFFNTVKACRMATHTVAIEGGVFVILASMTHSEKVKGGGFTAIIAPDGRALTEPVPVDWEGLVYCDLDFEEIYKAKQWVDPVGHYSRPDIFNLTVSNESGGMW
ncbi:hypothetical protein S7711_10114 [Stachybotrys chartarum IBT 7711]|uniref:CN hydrolase domain-containing protein n=1 Tax=Stachybotrys chartarum (strain CBS 109288 / IBT 7711) TaxID=1280523 RepID=A0A084B1L9_STACB|nr:hypothetical protein S7711_10114 [Stachybotrys chartarum IBT 7711]